MVYSAESVFTVSKSRAGLAAAGDHTRSPYDGKARPFLCDGGGHPKLLKKPIEFYKTKT